MRVLVVEDDLMIGQGLETALRQMGAAVDWIRDGEQALVAFRTTTFDLALLDLGLPSRDGLQILREVRQRGDATPRATKLRTASQAWTRAPTITWSNP